MMSLTLNGPLVLDAIPNELMNLYSNASWASRPLNDPSWTSVSIFSYMSLVSVGAEAFFWACF